MGGGGSGESGKKYVFGGANAPMPPPVAPQLAKVITSYRSIWITLLLLGTSAPFVLYCDWVDRGSRQIKRDPVDLVMDDYDITLYAGEF